MVMIVKIVTRTIYGLGSGLGVRDRTEINCCEPWEKPWEEREKVTRRGDGRRLGCVLVPPRERGAGADGECRGQGGTPRPRRARPRPKLARMKEAGVWSGRCPRRSRLWRDARSQSGSRGDRCEVVAKPLVATTRSCEGERCSLKAIAETMTGLERSSEWSLPRQNSWARAETEAGAIHGEARADSMPLLRISLRELEADARRD